MELSTAIRNAILEELEEYIETTSDETPAETLVAFLIEALEVAADEQGVDDVLLELEASGGLEGSLVDTLEEEMTSNAEFQRTAEEVISLLEGLCEIEWVDEE